MNQQTADKEEELLKWADDHANVIENEWMINLTAIKARIKMAFDSLVSEDEGFTKPCVCGSTMHIQHHWECLNCKKGIKQTDSEIAKRVFLEYCKTIIPDYEPDTLTQAYFDWLDSLDRREDEH